MGGAVDDARDGPLAGLRVVEAGQLIAAPMAATLLGDFGADVIKIENPDAGDIARRTGPKKNGIPLWWKILARNKRLVTLDLSKERGQTILKELIKDADVFLANFRPGTLERWNLGWDVLHAVNPRLVVVLISGFGQTGPYRDRGAFGTIAESMSGFAHITGEPDGPPTLPSWPVADSIAGAFGAMSAMYALYHRDHVSGRGQLIDLSIYEPLFFMLGAQSIIYDQLGIVQNRTGNRVPNSAPRNTYKTRDGHWCAVATGTQNVALRVMELVTGTPLDQRFTTPEGRVEHADEVDGLVAAWIRERSLTAVLEEFERAGAAIAPVYNIAEIFEDPQYKYRRSVVGVDDPDLGCIQMPNVFPFLSETPGRIRFPGPTHLGAHNKEVFVDLLGHTNAELNELKAAGVI